MIYPMSLLKAEIELLGIYKNSTLLVYFIFDLSMHIIK